MGISRDALAALYARKDPPFAALPALWVIQANKSGDRATDSTFSDAVTTLAGWWPKRKPSVAKMYEQDAGSLVALMSNKGFLSEKVGLIYHVWFLYHRHGVAARLKRPSISHQFVDFSFELYADPLVRMAEALSDQAQAGFAAWLEKAGALESDDWRSAWIELRRLDPNDPINLY